jgi:hypothetical protein
MSDANDIDRNLQTALDDITSKPAEAEAEEPQADPYADFKRELFFRQQAGAPEEQLESTLLAIDAVDRRRVAASVAS